MADGEEIIELGDSNNASVDFRECARIAGPLLQKLFSNLPGNAPRVGFVLIAFEIGTNVSVMVSNGAEPHLAIRAMLDTIASYQEDDHAGHA